MDDKGSLVPLLNEKLCSFISTHWIFSDFVLILSKINYLNNYLIEYNFYTMLLEHNIWNVLLIESSLVFLEDLMNSLIYSRSSLKCRLYLQDFIPTRNIFRVNKSLGQRFYFLWLFSALYLLAIWNKTGVFFPNVNILVYLAAASCSLSTKVTNRG